MYSYIQSIYIYSYIACNRIDEIVMGSVCIYHERGSEKCRFNQFVSEKEACEENRKTDLSEDLFSELLFLRARKNSVNLMQLFEREGKGNGKSLSSNLFKSNIVSIPSNHWNSKVSR